jgi:hypothetical protein
MRKARLLSTVAATLLLTVGAASAQAPKKDEAPAPAPSAQQSAPAEKVAPNMKAGEKNAETHKAPETVGQAPKASDADKTRATDKGTEDKGAMGNSDPTKPMDKAAETKSPADANGSADVKSKSSDSKTTDSKPMDSKSTTTGQGAASGSAKISAEQRTKISTVIRQRKVEPAHLTVSVNVGTRVPDSVHFYPLPQEVFVIYPEWRGYDYILVGDQIVVIDPRTHEIVAILDA